VENTTSEMGDPAYLRAFVDETRLTGLRFNFDIGHAHLADGPEEERIEKSFAPLRELVAAVHLHDNHGDKDEHLPPFEGSIDWAGAIKTLQSAPQTSLPIVLELKERPGPMRQALQNNWPPHEKPWIALKGMELGRRARVSGNSIQQASGRFMGH